MACSERYLDRLVKPEIHFLGRSICVFHISLCTALGLGVLSVMTLARYLGLSRLLMMGIVLAALSTFVALGMALKIITGAEQHAQYRYVIAMIGVATFLLWLLGEPILSYLDITIFGIGVFVIVGRVGCFMVGCCHGRPHRWGVCYRREHADVGFVSYYVGVRLFPIQLAESLWTLLIITVGGLLILGGNPPGAFLAWYVFGYALGRFCLEFWRGDPERPYLWGYSEAQWISIALVGFIVWAEYLGILPRHIWHTAAFVSLLLALIVISLKRSFQCPTVRQLLYPLHIREVAESLEYVSDRASEIGPRYRWSLAPLPNSMAQKTHIACTSLGIQVSATKINNAADQTFHYAISLRDGRMTEEAAKPIAKLILQLRRAMGSHELVAGRNGVFHLLIYSQPERLVH